MKFPRLCAALSPVVAAFSIVVWSFNTDSKEQPPAMPKEEQLKPKWDIGDSWVVETSFQPITFTARPPAGKEVVKDKDAPKPAPVVTQWKFAVAALEKLAGAECYRVEVTVSPDSKGQPTTRLWYDAKAMTLRQVEAQVPAGGGFTTITESYATDAKAPTAPAIGPLTALPVELPMFVGGKAGETTFSYEAVAGTSGSKRDPTDVAFAVDIRQTLTPVTPEKARELVPKSFTRDLSNKQVCEVTLKSPERNVVQLWEAGQPWPVFTSSGPTTSRLISVTRAKR